MGSRIEELAKTAVRGASRRQVLRGLLCGLIGVAAATMMPSGRTEALEANGQNVPAAPRPSATRPSLNQAPVAIGRQPMAFQIPSTFVRPNRPSADVSRSNSGAAPSTASTNQVRVAPGQGAGGWTRGGQPLSAGQRMTWLNQHADQLNQRGFTTNGPANRQRPQTVQGAR